MSEMYVNGSHRRSIRVKSIISFIMALFISLGVCLCLVSIVIRSGLLNEANIKKSINESTYYEDKAEILNDALKKRAAAAGLPESVVDGVITGRMVTLHVNKIINDGIHGKVTAPDTTELEEQLNNNIKVYLGNADIEINGDVTASIETFTSEVKTEYATQMTFNFINMFKQYHDKYIDITKMLIFVGIAVSIICTIITVMLHKRKYRGLRYAGYGVLAGSILSGIVSFIIRGKIINSVPSDYTSYNSVIRSYIMYSFDQGKYMCLTGILFFCLIAVAIYYLRREAI